jgi:hypothetical protein
MTFQKKVNKGAAVFLRKMGVPYPVIAEFCQCSISWCNLNLKDVKVDDKVIEDVYELWEEFHREGVNNAR